MEDWNSTWLNELNQEATKSLIHKNEIPSILFMTSLA